MTRKHLRVHRAALSELREAAQWYENQRPGLGDEFLAAVGATLERLTRFPKAGPVSARASSQSGVRSLIVPGFPYSVLYRDGAKEIRVFAIAHSRRRPGYWRKR